MEIKLGKYKHFKGCEVKVIGIAKHSETEEDMVVYEHTGDNPKFKLWVRPATMWFDHIERDGYSGPRFVWIGE